ncbi:hypothetical protein G9A89_020941 [Geosiphon pyriformis]|nr:hypothetical protein G9A89_020941 [Geosiphon pyriformis]
MSSLLRRSSKNAHFGLHLYYLNHKIPSPFWLSLRQKSARDFSKFERKPLFDKILIANRGEIACRVIRTAKSLGIKSVAVYSEADKNALHVKMADEAFLIGPAPSAESYLNIEKIISVAKLSGSQAIHPGYGFLSENSMFAQRLSEENITFIGPPTSAIIAMGSKSESKEIMIDAQVPVIPGYHGKNQEITFLKQKALEIGYPVLIKAVRGGGGKGMRIVNEPSEFEFQLESSKREAIKSFGDDQVLIEKYLPTSRHIEVQIFTDTHGNAVYLFERDCSIQRRHQKVLEEAPAPGLSETLRSELGEKAVAAAKAVNYIGAGTVEFIFDNQTQKFYFMEMNTRLQVEHPVTEMITHTDLVHWQLEVAAGNELPLSQEELHIDGHSFEARIYAENPENDFLPDTGLLYHIRTPPTSSNVRLETGFEQGDQISIYYDPMISKLVVKGANRHDALRVLGRALNEYEVVGLNTNIDFLKNLVSHRALIDGKLETGFIEKYKGDLIPSKTEPPAQVFVQAALFFLLKEIKNEESKARSTLDPYSPWYTLTATRLNTQDTRFISFIDSGDNMVDVGIKYNKDGTFDIRVGKPGGNSNLFSSVNAEWDIMEKKINAQIGDQSFSTRIIEYDNKRVFMIGQRDTTVLRIPDPVYLYTSASEVAGSVKTPMPCKISRILVAPGQVVEKGTPLMVLEAMKMEHLVKSPFPGIIDKIYYKVGDLVKEQQNLVSFREEP